MRIRPRAARVRRSESFDIISGVQGITGKGYLHGLHWVLENTGHLE